MNLTDLFNPSNIRDFVEGNYLIFRDRFSVEGIEQHLKEQAIYRAMLCKECLDNFKCVECGCKTPNMFYAPKKSCKKERWDKMLNAEDWEEFKIKNNIEISLEFFDNLNSDKATTDNG